MTALDNIQENTLDEDYNIVVRHPEEKMLQSGLLKGEKYLSRKIALIDAKKGKGKIVLIGFRPRLEP